MKNKGFTLIELIGTIVIISLILLVVVPSIGNKLKEGIKDADDQAKSNMELAAKNWSYDNKSELPQAGETKTITIQQLKTYGYLDLDIHMPSDPEKDISNSCIKITKIETGTEKNRYKYEYSESCQ